MAENKNLEVGSVQYAEDNAQAHPGDFNILYNAYANHSDVFGCVENIAAAVVANGYSFKTEDSLEQNEVEQNTVKEWFHNATVNQSLDELFKETVTHLEVSGNAYWNVVYNAFNEPLNLLSANPLITHVRVKKGEVIGYQQKYQGHKVLFEPEEMVAIKFPNPTNDFYGMSPLDNCINEVKLDFATLLANTNYFINDAMPATIVEMEGATDEDRKRMEKMMNAFKGAKNKWKVAVMNKTVNVKQIGAGLQDMQFVNARKLATEKVCASFKVPKAMLGYVDNANYSTANAMERSFYQRAVVPVQRIIENVVNDFIKNKLGVNNVKFEFNPVDFTERSALINELKTGQDMGWLSINDCREALGEERLDPAIYGEGVDEYKIRQAEPLIQLPPEPTKPDQNQLENNPQKFIEGIMQFRNKFIERLNGRNK